MFNKIRAALFDRALRSQLAEPHRKRIAHSFDSAQSIGLLFDATEESKRHEAVECAKNLEKSGKRVRLLGFFNHKQPASTTQFDAFTLKETSWIGTPTSDKALMFAQQAFDLLLCYNPSECTPMEWIAAHSKASMKVGAATERPHDFDLQLEIPATRGLSYFIEQFQVYSKKIVPSKHESSRTP
jgi:hypothetical protein